MHVDFKAGSFKTFKRFIVIKWAMSAMHINLGYSRKIQDTESTKRVNIPRTQIGHRRAFLTFASVIFIMLVIFHLKISKIACLTIKFSNIHQHVSSKVPFYWRKFSKSSIFTQPSSLCISFLRILDPEIPTFCGLCF